MKPLVLIAVLLWSASASAQLLPFPVDLSRPATVHLTQEQLDMLFQEFSVHLTIAQRVAQLEARVQELTRQAAVVAATQAPTPTGTELKAAPKTTPAREPRRHRSQVREHDPIDETSAADLNARYRGASPGSAK